MKIQLESTTKTVMLNGTIPARIWEGHTESGIPVHCFITRIACDKDADQKEFERDLLDCRQPSADVAAYPMRMVL